MMKVKVKYLRCLNKPDEVYTDVEAFEIDDNPEYSGCRLWKHFDFYDGLGCFSDFIILENVRYLHIDDGVKHYIIQVV